jgi:alkylation response protein AidB-like acyl-CoA dehydrogenase
VPRYALERKQFDQPIANFQAVQFMLADMAIDLEAMRLLTYKAAWEIDHNGGKSIYSSYAKAFGADRAMEIATNAGADFRGLRLHEGVSRREADARCEARADLRRERRRSSVW